LTIRNSEFLSPRGAVIYYSVRTELTIFITRVKPQLELARLHRQIRRMTYACHSVSLARGCTVPQQLRVASSSTPLFSSARTTARWTRFDAQPILSLRLRIAEFEYVFPNCRI